MCAGCGGLTGDPYRQLVIKSGSFSIKHYGGAGWRWSHRLALRYEPAAHGWFPHRAGGEHFPTDILEKGKPYVETVRDFGQVPFGKFTGNVGWDEGE
ncbi:hypothetical protein [Hymenobacter rubripertinctus]|uniref:Uncharacterized protein n=1 Tax=Hymenobacter rubripertinctus TaxID=2029981 RepID=A0A418QN50_9BACT|nr:hypothetical protein [Hymenobacter rubripertinctus]RIY06677.1 hypothetical protein D0T11_18170 [Hymenobacter rubripertinctus]